MRFRIITLLFIVITMLLNAQESVSEKSNPDNNSEISLDILLLDSNPKVVYKCTIPVVRVRENSLLRVIDTTVCKFKQGTNVKIPRLIALFFYEHNNKVALTILDMMGDSLFASNSDSSHFMTFIYKDAEFIVGIMNTSLVRKTTEKFFEVTEIKQSICYTDFELTNDDRPVWMYEYDNGIFRLFRKSGIISE